MFTVAPALADEKAAAPAGGVELGVRSGYALPAGDLGKHDRMTELVSSMVPVWLDVGYRVSRRVYVGAYAQYGFLSQTERACQWGTCSGNHQRVGLNAQVHFSPGASIDPWVGAGMGYEALTVDSYHRITIRGIELVNLQGGADVKLAPGIGFGPFASVSAGQYLNSTYTQDGERLDYAFGDERATHLWLTVGARAVFDAM